MAQNGSGVDSRCGIIATFPDLRQLRQTKTRKPERDLTLSRCDRSLGHGAPAGRFSGRYHHVLAARSRRSIRWGRRSCASRNCWKFGHLAFENKSRARVILAALGRRSMGPRGTTGGIYICRGSAFDGQTRLTASAAFGPGPKVVPVRGRKAGFSGWMAPIGLFLPPLARSRAHLDPTPALAGPGRGVKAFSLNQTIVSVIRAGV